MDPQTTTVETVLAKLASTQHGVVARAQLLRAGLTTQEIRDRVRSGALLREHRGVYRVGHRAPSVEARYLAAVLACGEGACLSGLARACHEAGVRYRTTPADVKAVLERRPRCRGAAKLRLVLSGDARVTLSALERRFLDVLSVDGLPLPRTNRAAGAHRVDCRWPERRLTVELDSYRFHHSRHAREQDRRREREARARGDEFRRYTWSDVFEEPLQMLAELRRLLG
jgi:very-short-patch-repair endonuclease